MAASLDRRLLLLLRQASRRAIAYTDARLGERVDISVAQLAALSILVGTPQCSLTRIASELDLNKSAVTSMARRLERSGLVERAENPSDGRGALLTITDKGRRVRKTSGPIFRGVMRELTEGFSPAELETVFRFLNRVCACCAGSP